MKRATMVALLEVQGEERQQVTTCVNHKGEVAFSENEKAPTLISGCIQIFP